MLKVGFLFAFSLVRHNIRGMKVKPTIDQIDEIAKIISKQECPFDFKCYKSGFEDLCGAVLGPILDTGSPIVECIDENRKQCRHSSPFASAFICTCPLRCYIARNFRR